METKIPLLENVGPDRAPDAAPAAHWSSSMPAIVQPNGGNAAGIVNGPI